MVPSSHTADTAASQPRTPTTMNNVHKLPIALKKRNSDIHIYTNANTSDNKSGSLDSLGLGGFSDNSTVYSAGRLRSATLLPNLTIPLAVAGSRLKSKPKLKPSLSLQNANSLSYRNRSQTLPFSTEIPLTSVDVVEKEPNLLSNTQTVYKTGPLKVIEPNVYLYSQGSEEIAKDFDLVINVAEELPELKFTQEESFEDVSIGSHKNNKNNIPFVLHKYWNHDSEIINDLETLTTLMHQYAQDTEKKVLVYCQCGVSRSASLIVAYYMRYHRQAFKDAYKHIQSIATSISPNMNLICQLVEWNTLLINNNYTLEESTTAVVGEGHECLSSEDSHSYDEEHSASTCFSNSSKSSPVFVETPRTPLQCAFSKNPFLNSK